MIINNSSVYSTRVTEAAMGLALYAASKAAVDLLTQHAALEGAPLHVRVNAINPGRVASEGALKAFGGSKEAYAKEAAPAQLQATPLAVEEIARMALFIADPTTGRGFNGSRVHMDAGVNVK